MNGRISAAPRAQFRPRLKNTQTMQAYMQAQAYAYYAEDRFEPQPGRVRLLKKNYFK